MSVIVLSTGKSVSFEGISLFNLLIGNCFKTLRAENFRKLRKRSTSDIYVVQQLNVANTKMITHKF